MSELNFAQELLLLAQEVRKEKEDKLLNDLSPKIEYFYNYYLDKCIARAAAGFLSFYEIVDEAEFSASSEVRQYAFKRLEAAGFTVHINGRYVYECRRSTEIRICFDK